MCRGSCKSSPESESRVCTPSRLMQLRKKRNKSKKEPVWRRLAALWRYLHLLRARLCSIVSLQAASSRSWRRCVLWSGSYTSPVTHNRCKSTDSFLAVATVARFFEFLAPWEAIFCP